MRIRDATADDLPGIVGLLADDELGQHREDTSTPLEPAYLEAFAAIDADPNHRLVVAEDEGGPVGTLQLTFLPHLTFRGGWRAQVEAVRTASGRRGEGIGSQLLRWAITESERHGCHLVQLTTNASRPDAHAFYEALGFEATHQGMKRYLTGGESGR
jgi:GNAT superfamily N-acetyltransferase